MWIRKHLLFNLNYFFMKHVLIQERKSLFLFLRYLLLLFVIPTELIAQSITISGTVTDSNKEAVIGANVVLKGTSTGTITDIKGKYLSLIHI